jgi:hypothetical protein
LHFLQQGCQITALIFDCHGHNVFLPKKYGDIAIPEYYGCLPAAAIVFLKRAMHKKAARGRLGLESL